MRSSWARRFHEGLRTGYDRSSRWYWRRIAGPLGSRYGWAHRRSLYPNPGNEPWRRSEIHVCRMRGLGDVLMCTPALREIRRLNPKCRINFYTDYAPILAATDLCDHVGRSEEAPANVIWVTYEHAIPPRRHIAKILGDCLGVNVMNVRPTCPLNSRLLTQFLDDWSRFDRHVVMINRKAANTPNKDWDNDAWTRLIKRLLEEYLLVEIGEPHQGEAVKSRYFIDLCGRTNLDQLIALTAAANVHVGPISAPIHIAAAVGTPSVVIYGGFEDPVCSSYPGNINLYTALPCSPCWLRDPCPIGKRCLSQISVATVCDAVRDQLLNQHRSPRKLNS
jgi:ADP-heptose:LPS heptosyltransferase